jgi:hypothetical protein
MTKLKVSSVCFDGAQEFGKTLSFKSFCHQEKIVMEPVAHYTRSKCVCGEYNQGIKGTYSLPLTD